MSLHLLDNITSPNDLKQLEVEQLPQLCEELREFLLHSVSQSGGHLAAGLGMVELTVALHYVYNTPNDKLIWDVGHQAYAHKILTGRKDKMHNIRHKGGISGFPKRDESEYDAFGVGHSSTSISAALGMQIASRLQGLDNHNVAIIGDGAMTAGMAYEALNDTAEVDVDLLVILNDNEMSISESVGGLSRYLARIISSKFYSQMRESGKKILANTPFLKRLARRAEEHTKGMILPSTMFEEMGFVYYGPIDGHNVIELVNTLENIKDIEDPRFMHVITEKGKGYEPAEQDPIRYHGVTPFSVDSGINAPKKPSTPTYTDVFGQWLCDMADQDERIVAITPAMREGSGLVEYSQRFPERYFDVAIAEQHAITVAAGMACEGLRPIVAIYSTFFQRGYDQLIHDVALQNLPVVFAVDRAGLVGNDGATHSGNFDYSFARCIPNMVIMAPSHEDECRQMLYTAYTLKRPCIVRYPKGSGIGKMPEPNMQALPYAQAEHITLSPQGTRNGAILLFGSLRQETIHAAEALNYDLYNMRFIKPIDSDTLDKVMSEYSMLVTVEDNAIMGGAGSAVNEYCHSQHYHGSILNIGLDDIIYPHGSRDEQLHMAGLTGPQITQQIVQYCEQGPQLSMLSGDSEDSALKTSSKA